MKGIKLTLVVLVTYILQTTVIPDFKFWGISPNLFLIVTCGLSFLFGSNVGAISGLMFGLLQDMNAGRAIGLNAFIYMYIGMTMGQFNKRFFKDNYIVCLIFIIFSTVMYETVIYIFSAFAYGQEFVFSSFAVKILIISLVNAITSMIVYPILLKINIGVELERNIFGRR